MYRAVRPWMKVLVRVAVGGGVFGVLIAQTDLGELWRQLRGASGGYVLAAFGLFLVGLGVSALRWREYLVALEYPMPYPTLFRLYFVGTFFNAFLPTGVGGDAYKALRIGRASGRGRTAPAFSSVFLDRFAGMLGLALIGLVLSLVRILSGDTSWVPVLALVAVSGILGAAALILGLGERLLGRGRLIPHTGVGDKIRRTVRGVHQAGRHPRAAAAGFVLGVVFQSIVVVMHLTIARGLDVDVPAAAMAAIVVLASVAVLVPISISGLGVVEFVYAEALQVYGVTHAKAVAFALAIRAIQLLASATGGVVYLFFGGEVSAEETPEAASTAADRGE